MNRGKAQGYKARMGTTFRLLPGICDVVPVHRGKRRRAAALQTRMPGKARRYKDTAGTRAGTAMLCPYKGERGQ